MPLHCIGAIPVIQGKSPKPVMDFLGTCKQLSGPILAAAPEQPGHFSVVFCTYGGGHTGIRETVPMLTYIGQTFEHVGIRVVDEWSVVGYFDGVNDPNYNTAGRLGSIVGRPNAQDLEEIRQKTFGFLHRLQYKLGLQA